MNSNGTHSDPLVPHARAESWAEQGMELLHTRFHYIYREGPAGELVLNIPETLKLLRARAETLAAEIGDEMPATCLVLAAAAAQLGDKVLTALRSAGTGVRLRQSSVSAIVAIEGEYQALAALLLEALREYGAGHPGQGSLLAMAAARCAHVFSEQLVSTVVNLQVGESEPLLREAGPLYLRAIGTAADVQRAILAPYGSTLALTEALSSRLGLT